MAQQTINIGTAANDGTGDPIRTAFDKCNDNFDELYVATGTTSSKLDLINSNDVSNLFLGTDVGANLTTPPTSHNGDGNTLVGMGVCLNATTMFAATIVGGNSGASLTSGDSNTSLGYQNLGSMTTGKWNVAIGVDVMVSTLTATNMVAIGHHTATNVDFALGAGEGVIIGAEAVKVGVGGAALVAIGYRSAYNSNASSIGNTWVGHLTGFTNTSGTHCTGIGTESLFANTTGAENAGFGYRSLWNNTTGSNNIAFGNFAGFTNTTGASSVFIGNSAGFYETASNRLFIDNAARASLADGRAKALVYGVFDAAPANQSLTVNGQLIGRGTPTNDDAATGYIGEYIEGELAFASRLTLTSATPTNIISISLTAGDWDVGGSIKFQKDTTTTVTYHIASLSTTSATLGTDKQQTECDNYPVGAGTNTLVIAHQRIKLAATTTVYLVANSAHASSFVKAWGAIFARRAR